MFDTSAMSKVLIVHSRSKLDNPGAIASVDIQL